VLLRDVKYILVGHGANQRETHALADHETDDFRRAPGTRRRTGSERVC
jgi:hypothetical protein